MIINLYQLRRQLSDPTTEDERIASELLSRIETALALLVEMGCDCECGHDWESHHDDCERCFGCRVADALQPEYR